MEVSYLRIASKANLDGTYGACCAEMDIWEANNAATAWTPHTCNITGVYRCSEPQCGDKSRFESLCDKEGCDFNSYRNGAQTFYGPGSTFAVDTTKPFTVVTQFITTDETATGQLKEIRRFYVQNGKKIPEAKVNVPGITATNVMTDEYCSVQKSVFGGPAAPNAFKTQGGMKGMSESLKRGMVLAMSIWEDAGSNMGWLDSTFPTDADPRLPGVKRGPCSITSGSPADILAHNSDAAVVFSKIRVGDIGTTA